MANSEFAVSARSLCKAYVMGEAEVDVLKDVTFDVAEGKFVVVCGASGAGKTTLLNIISGIDKPSSGDITVFGEALVDKDEDFLAEFRCNDVGFVFQSYNLVSTLTVAENVAFPMEWQRKQTEEIEARVKELLGVVGLQHRANHFPAQLSGGEQQRVAFARALANDPRLLLADEPTGNLDAENGGKIVQILRMLKAEGKTVIVSTHDTQITRFADQKLLLVKGQVTSRDE
jgi:putative ABC transport system ATP-binding protein